MNCKYSALLTDFYELAMMRGFHEINADRKAVFDMFFRRQPFDGGYAVFAGLEPMLKALENFVFSADDISYLKSLNYFPDKFLEYLKTFRFTGEIWAMPEGTPVFPNEPLIRVHSTMLEAQLIEPILLNYINFQTLIATKTSRVVQASGEKSVLEFGLRRAQGADGAISASRAAYVGGAMATSNVLAGKMYNIPVKGTMAHSWVMSFDSEIEAFEKFAEFYPHDCVLLVDTYDTLRSGVPNAAKIFKKLKDKGINNYGIRLDSGDLAFLSIEARKILIKEGVGNAKIFASNELDEFVIEQLKHENAEIDAYGVGTRMVTGGDDPALSGVYKLAAKQEGDVIVPSMKMTNNPGKMSNPGIKNVFRIFDEAGFMTADLVHLEDSKEEIEKIISDGKPIRLNHPTMEYTHLDLWNYGKVVQMLYPVMKNGKICVELPDLKQIQTYGKEMLAKLDKSYKRLLNPHIYKVSISNNLKNTRTEIIKKHSNL